MENMSENEIRNKRLNVLVTFIEDILIGAKADEEMPPLVSEEDAERRQRGPGLKIMTPRQMIPRLPILMNTLNSNTNKSNRFVYQFTDKLSLKNPNKNIALANLSTYYTWRNIKSKYDNNKFKIHAPTWNDEFNLPDGSYSV